MTVEITDANFEEMVLKAEKPILVDFWAVWCGPCKVMEPVLEEIAEEMKDTITVGKLNVDENQVTTGKFEVMSIPTMMLFKAGEPVEQLVGVMAKSAVEEKIRAAIA